jgi:branched-chain amino acid transport system substrate-binding protein
VIYYPKFNFPEHQAGGISTLLHFWRSTHWAKGIVPILVLAVALMAGACAGEEQEIERIGSDLVSRDPQTPIVIPTGEPIVIGVSAALTGPTASLGLDTRDAVVVGVERWKAANGDQISGHDIIIYVEDDGCFETDVTAFAAERLLSQEGLVGVIGPICSAGAMAAIPIYAEAGVVMISGTVTRTDVTLTQPEPRFFFRTTYTNAAEGILQARYAISQLKAATAYIIDDSEAYGIDLADWAQETLEESGRQVTREHIVPGAVDFSQLAAQIAADNPDVVIFEGYNPEGALLYRQLRDAGYGEPAEGVVIAGGIPMLPEEFLADYVEIVGHAPTTPFAGHLADAVHILLDAVAEVAIEQEDGSLVIAPLELREAVSNPKLLVGISGIIAFDENGDRVGNAETIGLAMCEIKDGEFVCFQF